MDRKGQNEGFRVLDEFVCEAIHAPGVPPAPPNKRGQNEGVRVLEELSVCTAPIAQAKEDRYSMSTFNIVDEANRRILAFVQQQANRQLIPGTGYYCTPFRGGLFGHQRSAAVAQDLNAGRAADVLWLGTNPCVPDSLEYITKPPSDQGHFITFKQQIESGFFGAWIWDRNGQPSPDWNPIDNPTPPWRLYHKVLATITGDSKLQSVAMANFIPWGSANGRDLVTRLGSEHPELLIRMMKFADDVNIQIVKALRPKLIVVPVSLRDVIKRVGSYSQDIRRIGLQMYVDREHRIQLPGQDFKFSTGHWQRSCLNVPTAYLRHPSSLRLRTEYGARVEGELSRVLASFFPPRP